MIKKIKERISNKKGMSTIEFAISLMVFILIFSYIFDLVLITYNQYSISEQTTQIARQIAKQSGCLRITPYNFPGGEKNYYSTTELYNIMNEKMTKLGITEDKWDIVIKTNGKSFTLTPTSPGFNTEYGEYISVETIYNYEWGLWSQFLPKAVEGKTVVNRGAFSEYNHDFLN